MLTVQYPVHSIQYEAAGIVCIVKFGIRTKAIIWTSKPPQRISFDLCGSKLAGSWFSF